MIPYVVVEGVGAEPLTLWFDANAVEALMERLKVDDLTEIGTRAKKMDVRVIRAMLWAALRRKHPGIDEAAAGALIDGTTFAAVCRGVAEAWARFMGVDPSTPPDPQTGSASPSGSTGAN